REVTGAAKRSRYRKCFHGFGFNGGVALKIFGATTIRPVTSHAGHDSALRVGRLLLRMFVNITVSLSGLRRPGEVPVVCCIHFMLTNGLPKPLKSIFTTGSP